MREYIFRNVASPVPRMTFPTPHAVRVGKATMSAPSRVELLHSEYAQFHRQHPSTLTQDQTRSLAFYRGERASCDTVEITDAVPRDIANWIRSLLALETFVRREGRLPRENRRLPEGAISTEEKQRSNSVRAHRRAFTAGRLCSYQVRRLLCIPDFSFQPGEDKWKATCAAYARFTAANGDAPKVRRFRTGPRPVGCKNAHGVLGRHALPRPG